MDTCEIVNRITIFKIILKNSAWLSYVVDVVILFNSLMIINCIENWFVNTVNIVFMLNLTENEVNKGYKEVNLVLLKY